MNFFPKTQSKSRNNLLVMQQIHGDLKNNPEVRGTISCPVQPLDFEHLFLYWLMFLIFYVS